MKKDQVHIGRTYVAKVSGQLARVRIDAESRFGGWDATNLSTHRKVRIKSAQRLRREVVSERTAEPVAAATAVIEDDRPPRDIDERLAAAPPSIVPYEERRARAEAAQADGADAVEVQAEGPADDGPEYDLSRCATARCRGQTFLVYLGRPLCAECWQKHCEEELRIEASESAGDACRPAEEPETPEQENDMSKKHKSTKKQAKVRPAAAKARREKKAAAPKPKAAVATAAKPPKAKKAAGEQKPKRVTALDAAAQVLAKAGKPMRAQELVATMAEQGLWTSPAGKTPHATLYAAMMREERDKGGEARFRKVDRGQFEYAGGGK